MSWVRSKWYLKILDKNGLYARVANSNGCSLLVYTDGTVSDFCKTYLRKIPRRGYYAEVHHGSGVFPVYADGTVLLLHPSQGLVQPQPDSYESREVLSHVRWAGRRLLRQHGVQC